MSKPMPVLVVEDSHAMQACLRELIDTVGGFRVVGVAGSETEATDWLHKHRHEWGLAVLDLLLPEGSGFTLVQRCRSEHPAGHIVVFSEFATPVLRARCIEIGADAVFRKSELAEFVRHLEGLAACEAPA